MPIWSRKRAAAPNVVELGGVAPNAKPQTAYDGLLQKLRELTRLSHAPATDRAAALRDYRAKALETSYETKKPFESPFLDRMFPYVHNEFLFNSARKLGPLAQVSHLVFGSCPIAWCRSA